MSPKKCSNSNAGNCKDAGTARRYIEEERVFEVDWSRKEGGFVDHPQVLALFRRLAISIFDL